MKELDRYGSPLFSYQGMGEVVSNDGETASVYFEARQTVEGGIIIGCLSQELLPIDDLQQVRGSTVERRIIETYGAITFAAMSGGSPGPQKLVVTCRGNSGIAVHRFFPPCLGTQSIQFALVNFMFEAAIHVPDEPLKIVVDDYVINISPVEDYVERCKQLRDSGGVLHTAWCVVERRDSQIVDPNTVRDFMSELLWPISLAIGSKVNWLFCVERDSYAKEPVLTRHQYALTRPWGETARRWRWSNDIVQLVLAWFDRDPNHYPPATELKRGIDHYLEAGAKGSYLETRGLSAATLLDTLAYGYTSAKKEELILPKTGWKVIRPGIVAALLQGVEGLAGISDKDREKLVDQLTNNLSGLNRRSFRQRLETITGDFGIPMSEKLIKRVVDSRNMLVHRGSFENTDRGLKYWEEYLSLLWTGRSVLLRMIGYDGLLPVKDDRTV